MSLLVVIPCLNEADNLDRLLKQFLADDAVDRLVVADGGSTDGSPQIVERFAKAHPRVQLLHNPDRIQSAGINRAVDSFGGSHQWLLRVDAHCEYPDSYAAMLLAAAAWADTSAVVVPMLTIGLSRIARAAAAAQNSVLGTGGSAHRHLGDGRFVDHGHHALMDLGMFRKLGGYCESMPCNEDAEYDMRQRAAGGQIWLEPEAAIIYFPRSSFRALARQYFRYGVGRARNVLRHRSRMHLRQMVPLLVPVALTMLPLAFVSPLFALPALSWLGLTLAAGLVVGMRDGGGWSLAAGPAAATMHAAWAFGFYRELLTNPRGVAPRYGIGKSAGASRS